MRSFEETEPTLDRGVLRCSAHCPSGMFARRRRTPAVVVVVVVMSGVWLELLCVLRGE